MSTDSGLAYCNEPELAVFGPILFLKINWFESFALYRRGEKSAKCKSNSRNLNFDCLFKINSPKNIDFDLLVKRVQSTL